MKLAIVTACPNGMVTSVLCARLLDAAAQRQGWSTSVEVHDEAHPERQLSAATLEAAEWVLVVSTGPLDMSRFVGKRVFQSSPSVALQDVDGVLRRGAEEAQVYVAAAAVAEPAADVVRPRRPHGRRTRVRCARIPGCGANAKGTRARPERGHYFGGRGTSTERGCLHFRLPLRQALYFDGVLAKCALDSHPRRHCTGGRTRFRGHV